MCSPFWLWSALGGAGWAWTEPFACRGRHTFLGLDVEQSVDSWRSLWCKRIHWRGSLQVSLGNITADIATNCGVTHNVYIYICKYVYIYIFIYKYIYIYIYLFLNFDKLLFGDEFFSGVLLPFRYPMGSFRNLPVSYTCSMRI